ncbi:hypothetical protein C8J56DRAFT_1105063 [Mycena floridula]|nr:hypothetical protein C8J56DRAFT_1105063 [Mycena floridula]
MSEDCTGDIEVWLRRIGEFIMGNGLPIMVATVFWTFHLVSLVVTVIVLWRKGFTRARTALLFLMVMMFVIDTSMYSLCLYSFFYQTRQMLLKGIFEGDGLARVQTRVEIVTSAYKMLALFMLIPGDCVVIWRACAVWTRSRIVMFIPGLFLLGSIVNFPFYVACNMKDKEDLLQGSFAPACFTSTASAWILSFCANISATLTIFYTAWSVHDFQVLLCFAKRDRGISYTQFKRSKVARILLLLTESGFIYFLVMIISITLALLPMHCGYGPEKVIVKTLNSITNNCIAMVPTLTILLVTLCGSFDEYSSTITVSQSIHFATPRVTELSRT